MTDLIVHRGPDDEGSYLRENFGLGHRRLAILDLSSEGHQPMPYMSRYVITYNGEVYNYLELRRELIAAGYTFRSNTDTEVILASYDKWGSACVDRFNGMWSFAIYDKTRKVIFCSRDRFGIKPFYFTEFGDWFLFASEIKQFTVFDAFQAGLNHEIAAKYLILDRQDHGNETFFENVYTLPGGHSLLYDLSSHSYEIEQWYDIASIEINEDITFDEAGVKLYKLFENSVMLRMRSDVKVGASLSGGLDSSAIVCMVKQVLGDNALETISSCYKEKKFDEQEFIDEVLRETNFIGHKVFPQLNHLFDWNFMDKMIYNHDYPIVSGSQFSEYNVFKAAKDHGMTVMLGGQGADEYLAGYGEFYHAHSNELFYSLKWIRLMKQIWFRKKLATRSYFSLLLHTASFIKRGISPKSQMPAWFNNSIEALHDPLHRIPGKDISIHTLSKLHLKETSIPFQLRSEDRNSMIHSIESRLPFLDYNLVEFVVGLPDRFKIKNGHTKAVLRSGLHKVLPAKVRDRKDKMGFVSPDQLWLKGHARTIRQELDNAVQITNGLINNKIIEQYSRYVNGQEGYDTAFFKVISLSRWINVFNAKV